MVDHSESSAPTNDPTKGGRRLIIAGVLVAAAELLHALLSSIAAGSIYPVAVFRFTLLTALVLFVIIYRANWARWVLVALSSIWAIGYAAQVAARMSFDLAVVAAGLLAGVILLATKPVSAYLTK